MRRLFCVAIALLSVSAGAQALPPGPPVYTGAPFSAERVVTRYQKLGDGTQIEHHSSMFMARDSAGRTFQRWEEQRDPLRPETKAIHYSLYDPNARTSTTWCSCSKIAMLKHFGEPRPAVPEHVPGSEGMDVYLGPTPANRLKYHGEDIEPKVLMGVQTRGSHVVRTVKAGLDGNDRDLVTTIDSWYSPELHLALLTLIDDPVKGKSRLEFEDLTRNEPDPSLFRLPEGYTEREADGR